MISISDPNPVLVEIILSVSENYPKVYHDVQHIFQCFVYFASNSRSYFAFNWTWLVEVVIWQVWNAYFVQLIMTSVTVQSNAWFMVVMVSGLANSQQFLVCIKW